MIRLERCIFFFTVVCSNKFNSYLITSTWMIKVCTAEYIKWDFPILSNFLNDKLCLFPISILHNFYHPKKNKISNHSIINEPIN